MKLNELKEKVDEMVQQNLGEMEIAFKHYGELPPMTEKEIIRVVIGAGRIVLE